MNVKVWTTCGGLPRTPAFLHPLPGEARGVTTAVADRSEFYPAGSLQACTRPGFRLSSRSQVDQSLSGAGRPASSVLYDKI